MKDPFTGDLQALQDANRRIAELEHQAAVVFDRHKYEQLEAARRIEARDKRSAKMDELVERQRQRIAELEGGSYPNLRQRIAQLEHELEETKLLAEQYHLDARKFSKRIAELEAEDKRIHQFYQGQAHVVIRQSKRIAALEDTSQKLTLENSGFIERIAQLEEFVKHVAGDHKYSEQARDLLQESTK